MKLKKSLYGLQQSPNTWFGTTYVELAVISFCQPKADSFVYVYEDETVFVMLTLYVDDVLFSASANLC